MKGPVFFVMPGLSFMHVRLVGERLRVECPGCGAVSTYRLPKRRSGPMQHQFFCHALDDCPTLQRIDRALLASRQADGTH